jgi:hypothetical protein
VSPARAVPILPCRGIDEQAAFYEAVGFAVTYRGTRPSPYLEVSRDGIVLQFYGLTAHEPGSRFDTCAALLDTAAEVDALHAAFRAGLRAALGRVPVRGLPRIGAVSDTAAGVRQFLLTDPAGNQVRVCAPAAPRGPAPRDRLARALDAATQLAESKEDPATAARVLDPVLDDARAAAAPLRVRALVLRAQLAAALAEPGRARDLLAEAAAVPVAPAELSDLAATLTRAADLTADLDAQGA